MPKSNCDANEYAGVVSHPGGHFPVIANSTGFITIQCGAFRRRYGMVLVCPGVQAGTQIG